MLDELVRYFLWLGTFGFGGPIALAEPLVILAAGIAGYIIVLAR